MSGEKHLTRLAGRRERRVRSRADTLAPSQQRMGLGRRPFFLPPTHPTGSASASGSYDADTDRAAPSSSSTPTPPAGAVKKPSSPSRGLLRTPAGGLASAAGLDALPPPPVAVRNLVELAQFAHLASNMSQMHHR